MTAMPTAAKDRVVQVSLLETGFSFR
jgi:hypothetical protein